MKREETKYSEWSKIPVPLQHQFFSHARDEASTCREKLLEQGKKLKQFNSLLEFKEVPEDDQWKRWRIACIDGSYSPATSERTGARYGVYCGGYMIFQGEELVKEGYRSGKLSQDQTGDPEKTEIVLRLLCTNLEREIASYCLEKEGIDLVIIDGSFFGFRARCSEIRDEEIGVEGFEKGGDLVDYIRDQSIGLMNSRKAVGIIKRVRTTAFDGWLVYKYGDEDHCIGRNDKAILASIIPSKHWFAYEWLFGSTASFLFFTRFRADWHAYASIGRSVDSVLRWSERILRNDIKRNLDCAADNILQTSRYYVRCIDSAPPFCFEAHKDVDVRSLLAYFQANNNPATGLPFPIDLIDENVSLPRGFTKEFVEEIEAILVRDSELDKFDLSNYFMYINPQKEE